MEEYQRLLRPRMASIEAPASLSRRLLALIIDVLLLDLVVTAPFTPLFASISHKNPFTMTFTSAQLAAVCVVFLLAFAYFALFEYALGQTPGMRWLNIRVRGQPRLWQAMARNIFLIPIAPTILLWIAEPLAVAMTRTSLLERLSGTRTVHARDVII